MFVETLTSETYEQAVGTPGLLIVDFWAPGCPPCVALAPVFEQAATRHPDVRFAKVNAEAEPDVAFEAMISAVPTLLVYRDGEVVHEEVGGLTPTELDTLIRDMQALDPSLR